MAASSPARRRGARHFRWLQEQRFDHLAHQIALQELVDAVRVAKERIVRIEAAIEEFLPGWSLAPVVFALRALRGVELIVAVTFVTEIGDMRRFDSPRQLMGFLGLVPGERSSGDTVRRGGITKADNGRVRHMLVESAWTYRHPPRVGKAKLYRLQQTTPKVREIALESPEPIDGALSVVDRQGQEDTRRLHGDRSRTGWLHVGGCQGGATNLTESQLPRTGGGGTKAGISVTRFVAGISRRPL